MLTGCSDLIDSDRADVVVEIEADDTAQVLRARQEALASASTWSGTRVAEETAGAEETALEFTLPGDQLDVALSALDDLDARIVATSIDVDAEQLDQLAPTPPGGADRATNEGGTGGGGTDEGTTADRTQQDDPDEIRPVRLRVEVTEAAAPGAAALVQFAVWVFAVIGVVASWRFVAGRWASRGARTSGGGRPGRRIERVDLTDDPPTQETPRVTPPW